MSNRGLSHASGGIVPSFSYKEWAEDLSARRGAKNPLPGLGKDIINYKKCAEGLSARRGAKNPLPGLGKDIIIKSGLRVYLHVREPKIPYRDSEKT